MPELPEVETIVRDLQQVLIGKKLTKIETFNPKSLLPNEAACREVLLNKTVKRVGRVGKALYLDFGKNYLLIHLKMTGQLVWQSGKTVFGGGHPIVNQGPELPNRFTRVSLSFGAAHLYFNDVRKFGWLKLLTPDELVAYSRKVGLEPLSPEFDLLNFRRAFAAKNRSKIKAALLDQKNVTGIGNIYADEALFRAGIKPNRLVGSLIDIEWRQLHKSVLKVLEESIALRGTSFSDYRDGHGQKGNFVEKLRVYGRGGQACLRCGRELQKAKIVGRGTVWCDYCQK